MDYVVPISGALAALFAFLTVLEARASRREERRAADRRDLAEAFRDVGLALVELDKAATAFVLHQSGGHLYEPAQTRLIHALGFVPADGLDTCWDLTGGPAQQVEEKIGDALVELVEARPEPEQNRSKKGWGWLRHFLP